MRISSLWGALVSERGSGDTVVEMLRSRFWVNRFTEGRMTTLRSRYEHFGLRYAEYNPFVIT